MKLQTCHSGESRSPEISQCLIFATKLTVMLTGFRPRIKYGVTFFRRNDGG